MGGWELDEGWERMGRWGRAAAAKKMSVVAGGLHIIFAFPVSHPPPCLLGMDKGGKWECLVLLNTREAM